jgi:polysaccharide biosynthesis transport protein
MAETQPSSPKPNQRMASGHTGTAARGGDWRLREILNGIFYSSRLILISFFIPIILASLFSTTLKTIYSADTRLLVLLSRQHVLGEGLGTAGFGGSLNMQARIVRAESQILTSRELREETVEKLGLEAIYPALIKNFPKFSRKKLISAAANKLEQDITIELSSQSDIMHIRYEHPNPVLAADLVNTLVELYLERRQTIFASEGMDILENRLSTFEQEMADIDLRIDEIRQEIDISDFNVQRVVLLKRLAGLEESMMRTKAKVEGVSARNKELELLIGLVPEEIEVFADDGASGALISAMRTVSRLEQERARLSNTYRLNSRFLVDVNNRISSAQATLIELKRQGIGRKRMGRNATYDKILQEMISLQAQQRSQEAQIDEQMSAIKKTRERISTLDAVEVEHNQLMLTRIILIEKIKQYEKRLEKERLAKQLENLHDDPTIRVIEKAVPDVEGRSARHQIIAIGILFGFIVSLGVIYLASIGRTIMVTPEEVQRTLELPVLVSIGHKN